MSEWAIQPKGNEDVTALYSPKRVRSVRVDELAERQWRHFQTRIIVVTHVAMSPKGRVSRKAMETFAVRFFLSFNMP